MNHNGWGSEECSIAVYLYVKRPLVYKGPLTFTRNVRTLPMTVSNIDGLPQAPLIVQI